MAWSREDAVFLSLFRLLFSFTSRCLFGSLWHTLTQPCRPSFLCETDSHEATGAPKSPKHKFSDSHSSLSSYTSSSRSGSHSRISSMSTVSGIQPLGSLLTDVPEAKVEPSDVPVIHDVSMSPRGSLHMANSSPPMPAEPRMRDHERPQSPSDAILITRGSNQLTPEDGIRYVICFPYLKLSPALSWKFYPFVIELVVVVLNSRSRQI